MGEGFLRPSDLLDLAASLGYTQIVGGFYDAPATRILIPEDPTPCAACGLGAAAHVAYHHAPRWAEMPAWFAVTLDPTNSVVVAIRATTGIDIWETTIPDAMVDSLDLRPNRLLGNAMIRLNDRDRRPFREMGAILRQYGY